MFWRFSDDYEYDTDWDEDVDLEQIICPVDPHHRRAGKRITDLSVVLPHGTVPDILWVHDCIIQDRVLHLFRNAGLTGFEVRAVKARFENSSDHPPMLWELRVTGWGGVAPTESGMRLINHCPACGDLEYSGTSHPESILDKKQWDGSDFFFVWPLPRFIFVTDRVARVVREHKLTGVKLIEPSELKPIRGASPGRLHYYLPIARAHELGDALDIY